MAEESVRPRVHWAVKVFVLFHIVMITSWSLPKLQADQIQAYQSKSTGQKLLNVGDGILIANQDFMNARNPVTESLMNFTATVTGNADFRHVDNPLYLYLLSTGLWQGWDMFAPNPADTDVYVQATVTFKDGTDTTFTMHRIKDLPIFQKFVDERFRKYREHLSNDTDRWKWPQTAYRFALIAKNKTGKEPDKVVLTRLWQPIQPPGKETPETYNSYDFYTTFIDSGQMKKLEAQ